MALGSLGIKVNDLSGHAVGGYGHQRVSQPACSGPTCLAYPSCLLVSLNGLELGLPVTKALGGRCPLLSFAYKILT